GMSIDLQRVVAEPLAIVAGVLVLLAVKGIVLFGLGLRPGRLDVRGALLLAGVLALGGEVAFVVFGEASRVGLLDDAIRDRLVAVVALSMAATPLQVMLVLRFAPAARGKGSQRAFDYIPDDHPQVLIAGFGRF